MTKGSIKDRLRYGIFGAIAVLIGIYFIILMWGKERHFIASKINGIPFLLLIPGLFAIIWAIFGKTTKNKDPKTKDQQSQEPGL